MIERTKNGGMKLMKSVRNPRPKQVALNILASDLPKLEEEEIIEMGDVFLLYSFDCPSNPYDYKECRIATNMCIRELNRRETEDHQEELTWED